MYNFDGNLVEFEQNRLILKQHFQCSYLNFFVKVLP